MHYALVANSDVYITDTNEYFQIIRLLDSAKLQCNDSIRVRLFIGFFKLISFLLFSRHFSGLRWVW